MNRKQIDLNCDLGESFGAYKIGYDEEVIKLVSSVNVACGYHGGDPNVMDKTVAMAKQYNVGVGAHPSFPDRLGFGRWNMDIPPETLANIIIYQIGALDAFCQKHHVNMQHVKPHGNLNNMADTSETIALSIVEAVRAVNPDLPIFVKPQSELERVARKQGQPVVLELFADRAYQSDLTLVPRTEPDAMITDPEEAADHVLQMVMNNQITANTGEAINITGETICVHGDTPTAVHMIKVITDKLKAHQIEIGLDK